MAAMSRFCDGFCDPYLKMFRASNCTGEPSFMILSKSLNFHIWPGTRVYFEVMYMVKYGFQNVNLTWELMAYLR